MTTGETGLVGFTSSEISSSQRGHLLGVDVNPAGGRSGRDRTVEPMRPSEGSERAGLTFRLKSRGARELDDRTSLP